MPVRLLALLHSCLVRGVELGAWLTVRCQEILRLIDIIILDLTLPFRGKALKFVEQIHAHCRLDVSFLLRRLLDKLEREDVLRDLILDP